MKSAIVLAGYYGYGNVGDEAILQAIAHDVQAVLGPAVDLRVLTARPQAPWPEGVQPVDYRDPNALITALDQARLLIIGGGGLFQDYWGTSDGRDLAAEGWGPGLYYRWALWAKLAGASVLTYAVGVGPVRQPAVQHVLRRLYALGDAHTVRDRASWQTLQDIGVDVSQVRVTADPAVAFQGDTDWAQSWLAARGAGPWLVVNARPWPLEDDTAPLPERLAAALDRFLQVQPHQVVFVPFQLGQGLGAANDLEVVQQVRASMRHRERTHVLPPALLTPARAAGLIAAADLVVGMRLHSAVFAVAGAVPFVALAYDPKVRAFAAEGGLEGQVVDLSFTPDALYAHLQRTWETRGDLVPQLRAMRTMLRQRAADNRRLLRVYGTRAASEPTPPAPRAWRVLAPAIWQQIGGAYPRLRTLEAAHQTLQQRYAELEAAHHTLQAWQMAVTRSRAWRLVQVLWRFRLRLLPPGAWHTRALARTYRALRRGLRPTHWARALLRYLLQPRGVFGRELAWDDHTEVVLYTDRADFWPDYRPRRRLQEAPAPDQLRVSVIMAVKNEADTATRTWQALLAQRRLPDEVVIVDTGSTDETVPLLRRLAQDAPFPVQILEHPGFNIAQARNAAVRAARHSILATADFGTLPDPWWLESLLKPFADDAQIQVVGGLYRPIDEHGAPSPTAPLWGWYHPEWLYPATYLPPGVSTAFRREAWQAVGGYPEWLTMTGEDTLFAIALKQQGGRWAFVPEATVRWIAPRTLGEFVRKMYRWSIGDGESGAHASTYWKYLLSNAVFSGVVLLALLALLSAGLVSGPLGWRLLAAVGGALLMWRTERWFAAQGFPGRWAVYEFMGRWAKVLGFWKGARRRPQVERRKWASKRGAVVVLAPVPLDDTGGGSRFAQLALALARADFQVFYFNRYPKYESVDLGLHLTHPNLEAQPFTHGAYERFWRAHQDLWAQHRPVVLVEFPHPDFVPWIQAAKARGATVVYDVVDAWDTDLGGDWYRREVELTILRQSDLVLATAEPLVAHIRRLSGRDAILVPNAVNRRIFDPRRAWPRPEDLPEAVWSALYIGALWGSWFAWDLLARLAQEHPEAAIVVIGDYRGQSPVPMPSNVHFLGLKPQRVLPAYLQHVDVALVPWKINAITRATSPLKVYEYLAMHRPVVAPDIPPLEGAPGIWRYQRPDEFVAAVERAQAEPFPHDAVEAFIQQHTWEARVRQIVAALQAQQGRQPDQP